MFGHLQLAITSGSHKLLQLSERLGSIRSFTSFVFPYFVPWHHHMHPVKNQSRTPLISDEQKRIYTNRIFSNYRNTREVSKDNFTC